MKQTLLRLLLYVLFFSVITLTAFKSDIFKSPQTANINSEAPWENLLRKDLSKWEMYLSYSHKSNYSGMQPVDKNGAAIKPVGYNKNEKNVFSVIYEQGDPVLRISGEIYGCVFTRQEYKNFHLKLKQRWGTKLYGPRIGKLKDSGILYYSQGEAGVDYWRAWMLSQEFQIMQGHIGDYWNIASSAIEIRAYLPEGKMNSIADAGQPFIGFGSGSQEGVCLRNENYEKPLGQWNTIELVCFEGKSLHIVNGHVVMVLRNSHYVKEGKSIPLDRGKIQLQSEGSEVFYKDIQLKELNAMPEEYRAYYTAY